MWVVGTYPIGAVTSFVDLDYPVGHVKNTLDIVLVDNGKEIGLLEFPRLVNPSVLHGDVVPHKIATFVDNGSSAPDPTIEKDGFEDLVDRSFGVDLDEALSILGGNSRMKPEMESGG